MRRLEGIVIQLAQGTESQVHGDEVVGTIGGVRTQNHGAGSIEQQELALAVADIRCQAVTYVLAFLNAQCDMNNMVLINW